jgi:hypothetical protein
MSSRPLKHLAVIGCAAIGIWLLGDIFRRFGHFSGSNPRSTFEYFVARPIPPSVDRIQEGGFRTLDSVFRVLCFKIETPDLEKIVGMQGFKPVGKDELTQADYLKGWERRIEHSTKLKVHFTADWKAYRLTEGHGTKYIFCDTNTSEAVFVADAH